MGDSELEAIHQRRLAEMQAEQGGGGEQNKQNEQEQRKKQADEMKHQILSQVLDQKARARLNTLILAKPEKGMMVENMLINMARMGQLGGKLTEEELIGLLERVSEKTQNKTSVKFDRRRTALDSDDEDLDL